MPHKIIKSVTEVCVTWGDALRDAQKQLAEARKRVRQLAQAVRVCEDKVRRGEPFPGQRETPELLGRD